MVLDINYLKDFFPFGSAMIGAMTGGFITYRIAKAKEKKESHQKRVESILELQAKLSEMRNETMDYKMETLLLQEKSGGYQESDRIGFLKTLKGYYYEQITGNRETLYSLAIHIDKNVFVEVGQTYNKIYDIFEKTRKDKFQGDINKDFEEYLEMVTNTMEEIKLEISKLMTYLLKKELEYAKYFLEKYI